MTGSNLGLLISVGILGIFSLGLLIVLFRAINQITETNKQLLIVVAGKDEKPETLRALVASNKPPQGKLKGIADGKKKKDKNNKPVNTNYTMSIGV